MNITRIKTLSTRLGSILKSHHIQPVDNLFSFYSSAPATPYHKAGTNPTASTALWHTYRTLIVEQHGRHIC